MIIYCRLIQKLKQNKTKILADIETLNSIESTIDDLNIELTNLKAEIEDVYIFESDLFQLDESLKVN